MMTPNSGNDAEPTDDKDNSEQPQRRISSEYNVDAWPAFIVLDQTGRVAEAVDGNADDLVEHLSQVVDNLLADPPAK